MWHDYDDLYIYVLYDDLYEGFHLSFRGLHPGFYGDDYVATRLLWTDLWRGHIRA